MTETDEILRHEAFDEATKKLVCDAFNNAWLYMLTRDNPAANTARYPEARDLLARRIIGATRMGMRDLDALRQEGVRYVRETLTPEWPKG
ncbi:MAG: hypothetical protein WCE79_12550 [Xanthobacteraceae bacterium]